MARGAVERALSFARPATASRTGRLAQKRSTTGAGRLEGDVRRAAVVAGVGGRGSPRRWCTPSARASQGGWGRSCGGYAWSGQGDLRWRDLPTFTRANRARPEPCARPGPTWGFRKSASGDRGTARRPTETGRIDLDLGSPWPGLPPGHRQGDSEGAHRGTGRSATQTGHLRARPEATDAWLSPRLCEDEDGRRRRCDSPTRAGRRVRPETGDRLVEPGPWPGAGRGDKARATDQRTDLADELDLEENGCLGIGPGPGKGRTRATNPAAISRTARRPNRSSTRRSRCLANRGTAGTGAADDDGAMGRDDPATRAST